VVARGLLRVVAIGLLRIPLVYNEKGSDIVTKVRFPLVVPYLQLELCKLGALSDVDIDALFGQSS
jgi:hypothetical protein